MCMCIVHVDCLSNCQDKKCSLADANYQCCKSQYSLLTQDKIRGNSQYGNFIRGSLFTVALRDSKLSFNYLQMHRFLVNIYRINGYSTCHISTQTYHSIPSPSPQYAHTDPYKTDNHLMTLSTSADFFNGEFPCYQGESPSSFGSLLSSHW